MTGQQHEPTPEDILATIDEKAGVPVATFQEPGQAAKRPTKRAAKTTAKKTAKTTAKRTLTEFVPEAARAALERPRVAELHRNATARIRDVVQAEDRLTDSLKALARVLMELRGEFKEPGGTGPDWLGKSVEYQALAHMAYLDAGVDGPRADSTRRAVRYHMQALKREMIPRAQWEHYGVHAAEQAARTLGTGATSLHDEAVRVAKGEATGRDIVRLTRTIQEGVEAYTPHALHRLTPKQREAVRESAEVVRARADEVLRMLDQEG